MIRRVLADDMAAHPRFWQMFAILWAIFAAIVMALAFLMAG